MIRGRSAIGHGGGVFDFVHESLYIPLEDLFVAVFSINRARSASLVAKRLVALALGEPYPEFTKVAVPPSEIQPLLGLYEYEGGNRRFFRRDGRLFARVSGGSEVEVFPTGNDRVFYGPETGTWFEVKRDPDGRHVMSMYPNGGEKALTSVRTGPVPPETRPR